MYLDSLGTTVPDPKLDSCSCLGLGVGGCGFPQKSIWAVLAGQSCELRGFEGSGRVQSSGSRMKKVAEIVQTLNPYYTTAPSWYLSLHGPCAVYRTGLQALNL